MRRYVYVRTWSSTTIRKTNLEIERVYIYIGTSLRQLQFAGQIVESHVKLDADDAYYFLNDAGRSLSAILNFFRDDRKLIDLSSKIVWWIFKNAMPRAEKIATTTSRRQVVIYGVSWDLLWLYMYYGERWEKEERWNRSQVVDCKWRNGIFQIYARGCVWIY